MYMWYINLLKEYDFIEKGKNHLYWGVGSFAGGTTADIYFNNNGKLQLHYRKWNYNCNGDCTCNIKIDTEDYAVKIVQFVFDNIDLCGWKEYAQRHMRRVR